MNTADSEEVLTVARSHGTTPAQVRSAWTRHQGPHMPAIPAPEIRTTSPRTWPLVRLETGTPMWRTLLPGGTHLREIPPQDRPAGGYPAEGGRWPQNSALIHLPAGAGQAVFWSFRA